MNKLNTLLAVAMAVCGAVSASASETTAPAAAAATPAVSAAPATAAVPAAQANSSKASPADAAAKATTAVPAGYKARVVDGETRYCRKSTPMGTRFPTEVCMTHEQYLDSIRNQNALRQELTGKQKSYSNTN